MMQLLGPPRRLLLIACCSIAWLSLGCDLDSDQDGLSDRSETWLFRTDPLDPDTDGDDLRDGFEVRFFLRPLDPDQDGNGRSDGLDDFDGDGLSNRIEQRTRTNPRRADTDRDGLTDSEEVATGEFGAQRTIGSVADLVFLADLDGDRAPDVLAASREDGVFWYENADGRGSFGPPQTVLPGPFSLVSLVSAADLDGDGDNDVLAVTLNGSDRRLEWFENTNGRGSFGPPREIPTGQFLSGTSARPGDLDGDGDVDLLVLPITSGPLLWLENTDGRGSFEPRQLIDDIPAFAGPIAVGDVDGDGDVDALLGRDDRDPFDNTGIGRITWYENLDGSGSFGPDRLVATRRFHRPLSMATADADGDGYLDVFWRSSTLVAWSRNADGQGAFEPPRILADAGPSLGSRLLVADVDLDEDVDVFFDGANSSRLTQWRENLDGLGDFGLGHPFTSSDLSALAGADVDGDGDVDLVFVDRSVEPPVIVWLENLNVGDPTDRDSDDDGLLDGKEYLELGTDPRNPDTDGDGLSDRAEVKRYRSDPLVSDSDGDGLLDGEEVFVHRTSPTDEDSDGDGLPDGFEVAAGFRPNRPGEQALDPDGDGLDNLGEFLAGTDPHEPDSDGDGLTDGDEVLVYGTDPTRDGDADRDLLKDAFEIANGFDPLDPDEDGNGRIDGVDDADGDGLANAFEIRGGLDPLDSDSDDDGLSDGEELGDGDDFRSSSVASADSRMPLPVHAADLDGDGDPDIVAARQRDVIWVENEDGRGSFGDPQIVADFGFSEPFTLAVADVDGDGDIDILTSTSRDGLVWIENVDGQASFGPPQTIAADAFQIRSPFPADLDGDGAVDILSSGDRGDGIVWYRNDGAGGFEDRRVISSALTSLRSLSAADLDGDDDLDLVWTSTGLPNRLSWQENLDARGQFGPERVITTELNFPRSIATADVDADGDLDVLSASFNDGKVAWYENTDALGSFGPQRIIQGNSEATVVTAVDTDGNGSVDVVAIVDRGNEIRAYDNRDGTGAFGSTPRLIAPFGGVDVVSVDIDGDGDFDLVLRRSGSITWLENVSLSDPRDPDVDGDGLLDGEELNVFGTDHQNPDTDSDGLSDGDEVRVHGTDPLEVDSDDDFLVDGAEVNQHGTGPLDPDSDGDGLRDGFELVSGFDPLLGGEELLDPDGDGLTNLDEQTQHTKPLQPDSDFDGISDGDEVQAFGTSPIHRDTDGDDMSDPYELAHSFDPTDGNQNGNGTIDGREDLDADGLGNAAEDATGTDPRDPDSDGDGLVDGSEVASGEFGPQERHGAAGRFLGSLATADLDGDRDNDIVTVDRNAIVWLENVDGDGTFSMPQVISSEVDGPNRIRVADLDGDGDNDVLSPSTRDNKLSWYENLDGEGTFGPQRTLSTSVGGELDGVEIVDLDADGDLDVVTAGSDRIVWYENLDTAGTFAPARVISSTGEGTVVNFLSVTDLDGDGDMDVFSSERSSGSPRTLFWLENLDGAESFDSLHAISTEAEFVATARATDIDGDGDRDILVSTVTRIFWYENTDGAGDFGPARLISTESELARVEPVDVDSDGDLDVLAASSFDGEIVWYEHTDGAGSFAGKRLVAITPFASYSTAADLDGDGDLDVLRDFLWFRQLNQASAPGE